MALNDAVWSPDLLNDPAIVVDAEIRAGLERSGEWCVLAAPLRVKGQAIGALTVSDTVGRAFTEAEVALLTTFADQAALALENARLNAETQQRLRETETLLAVSQAVGAPLDLTETMRRLARETGRVLGADMVGAYVPTADGAALVPLAGYHVPKPMLPSFLEYSIPLRGHPFLEEMWTSQHPVWSSDVGADARLDAELLRRVPHRSQLALPMVVKGAPIGVLFAVWWDRARQFAPAEIRLVEAIARQAAAVLASARLYESLARNNAHLEVLFETARRATLSLHLDEILPVLVQSAMELIGGDGSSIRLLDPAGTTLEAVAHHGLGQSFTERRHVKMGEGFSRAIVDEGKTIAIEDLLEDRRYVQRDVALAEGLRSLVITPLRSRDRVIGALVVYSRRPRRYSEEETALLAQFANLAAIAIENATLFAETERRRRAAESLAAVGRTLSEELDPDRVGQRVADSVCVLLGASSAAIYRLDAETEDLVALAIARDAGAVHWMPVLPRGTGLVGLAIAARSPVTSPDVLGDPRVVFPPERRIRVAAAFHRAMLAIPLRVQDRVLGVLAVGDRTGRVFGAEEIQLAQVFADQAAIALQNAQLYDEARARLARTRRLAELSHIVTSSLDFRQVLDVVTGTALDLLKGDMARLWVIDEVTAVIRVAADRARQGEVVTPSHEYAVGEGIVGWVIATKTPRYSANLSEDPLLRHRDLAEAGYVSQMTVPLKVGDRAVGALSIVTRAPRRFTGEDEELLQIFAATAATALENASLYQKGQQAYAELSRTQEQLTQSQKMEAVGRLAGGIAHDFNNLLTIIAGRAQILLEDLLDEDPTRRHAELIMQTADRAAALTRQLLAFSRKQVLQPKVFDLNTAVATMSAMLQRLIGEDIILVTVLHPALGHVNADPGQIEQVVMNLAVNARDAMDHGGTLTIETANVELDAAGVAGTDAARPGPHVMLAVTDTGSGMDAETLARIFEPFFTTKPRGKGTGLGLSTVYGIVKQSSGTITVESRPGRGSTFRVYLPRADRPVERAGAAAAPARAPHGTETVLLVEDEPEVLALASETLAAQGYRVLLAANGPEALALGARHPGLIDLMVTDVVMPQMSGPELARRMRPTHPAMRVLFMSGYTDDAIGQHGLLETETAYLQKPFTPSVLARKVREVLEAPR
jgi:GAF domain-containing protein